MLTKNAPNMLSKCTPFRLRAAQNSVDFFCVFCVVFRKPSIFHTFFFQNINKNKHFEEQQNTKQNMFSCDDAFADAFAGAVVVVVAVVVYTYIAFPSNTHTDRVECTATARRSMQQHHQPYRPKRLLRSGE